MPDTVDYCIHEMVRDNCVLCQPKSTAVYWDALYSGSCPACARPIEVGDRVRWSTDGTAAVHARHGNH